jgi:hypothetical protein
VKRRQSSQRQGARSGPNNSRRAAVIQLAERRRTIIGLTLTAQRKRTSAPMPASTDCPRRKLHVEERSLLARRDAPTVLRPTARRRCKAEPRHHSRNEAGNPAHKQRNGHTIQGDLPRKQRAQQLQERDGGKDDGSKPRIASRIQGAVSSPIAHQCTVAAPQHFLYFLPDPHGHGSFRPTFALERRCGPACRTEGRRRRERK